MAGVEHEAIEAVARAKRPQWEAREQQLRETEWSMHERAIAAAKRGLDAYMEREKVYANLADIARMLEIASKLGRLATGLGTDGERRKGDDPPAVRVEVTVALGNIYGEPLPGEVVDVEEVGIGPMRQIAMRRLPIAREASHDALGTLLFGRAPRGLSKGSNAAVRAGGRGFAGAPARGQCCRAVVRSGRRADGHWLRRRTRWWQVALVAGADGRG
ncbi:MAG: hypothetical protein IH623_02270 [Verrucomicrobia bacterium]|nr:hypothetical protein [Verrucomicrobiota bacterium]